MHNLVDTSIQDRIQKGFSELALLHPHLAKSARFFQPVTVDKGQLEALRRDICDIYEAHRVVAANLAALQGPEFDYLRSVLVGYRRLCLADEWARFGVSFTDFSAPDAKQMFARPDCIPTSEGLKIVETNFDTGIAGIDMASDILQMAYEVLRPEISRKEGDTITALANYFESRYGDRSTQVQWFSTPSTGRQRMCEILVAKLNSHSKNLLHTINHPRLDSEVYFEPGYRQVFHRSASLFTINSTPTEFQRLFRGIMDEEIVHSVPSGNALLSSKIFLAILRSNAMARELLSPAQKAAIDARIPWTGSMATLGADELRRVTAEKDHFVLKLSDSYRGLDVKFGCSMTNVEWSAVLTQARSESINTSKIGSDISALPRHWIVQERLYPNGCSVREFQGIKFEKKLIDLVVGPFFFGDRIGGLMGLPASTNPGAGSPLGFFAIPIVAFDSTSHKNYSEDLRETNNLKI